MATPTVFLPPSIAAFNQMQRVIPGLFIGNAVAARDVSALKRENVTHIVAANGMEPWELFKKDFKYLVLVLEDHEGQELRSHFVHAHAFIDEAIQAGGSVLVHCTAGISRSCAIVASYLMAKHKSNQQDTKGLLTAEEAIAMVRAARPWVKPNSGFIAQLKEYEKTLLTTATTFMTTTTTTATATATAIATADRRGKKPDCELCQLERRMTWYDDSDPRFVVLECDSCTDNSVMIVWRREHTMEISEQDARDMEAALARVADRIFTSNGNNHHQQQQWPLGRRGWILDKTQRNISDHLHWHARSVESPLGVHLLMIENFRQQQQQQQSKL